jgi:hypothetical protein
MVFLHGKNIFTYQKADNHTKKQIITPDFFPRAKVPNFFGATFW